LKYEKSLRESFSRLASKRDLFFQPPKNYFVLHWKQVKATFQDSRASKCGNYHNYGSIFLSFGLISNLFDGYSLAYNLFQGIFMSLFTGGALYGMMILVRRRKRRTLKKKAAQDC